MSAALRAGVVGVGFFGQHHARLLSGLSGVQLVGVADVNFPRAREIAEQYGGSAYGDARGLLAAGVDAVTIAAPTALHAEVATPFVEAGIPVLIEKPITASLAEADRLLEAASRHGTPVAVGHTERFNPAVAAALPLMGRPRFVEIHRLGTFPDRSLDVDVIFDLMIHDLDLLLKIVGSEVVSIEAIGVNVLTPRVDIANARLRFASGCIANVTASRISRDRVRKARFFQPDTYVSIDYAAQEAEMYRLTPTNGRPQIQGGRLDVVNEEPLRRELLDFVEAIRHGRSPGVTGRDGREALALATRVAEIIRVDVA
jgi:predicted dehydrogenase